MLGACKRCSRNCPARALSKLKRADGDLQRVPQPRQRCGLWNVDRFDFGNRIGFVVVIWLTLRSFRARLITIWIAAPINRQRILAYRQDVFGDIFKNSLLDARRSRVAGIGYIYGPLQTRQSVIICSAAACNVRNVRAAVGIFTTLYKIPQRNRSLE